MPPKAPSLKTGLAATKAAEQERHREAASATIAAKPPSNRTSYVAPSRRGQVQLAGYFDPAVIKQFKMLALELDASAQYLLAVALNDLFEKHGRPRIADERMLR
jgi:hypothetical protein